MTSGSVESTWIGAGCDERHALGDAAHLLGLVVALDERDAEVEHVRAAVDLVLGDLVEAVVVVGEQHLLGLARALRVHALADHRRARLLHERRRGDHRADVHLARRRARLGAAALEALGEHPDVVGRRAAAAADDAHVVARRRSRSASWRTPRGPRGRSSRRRGPGSGCRRSGCTTPAPARTRRGSGSRRACPPGPVEQFSPIASTLERLERRQHGRDVGAEQHLAAVGQQRDLRLDRHLAAGELHRLAGAEDRGLDLEDVLRGLDEDEVDAALDEAEALLGERCRRACGRRCRRASGRRRRAGSRSGRSSRRRSASRRRPCARSRRRGG